MNSFTKGVNCLTCDMGVGAVSFNTLSHFSHGFSSRQCLESVINLRKYLFTHKNNFNISTIYFFEFG